MIELGPRAFAVAHLCHRRLVALAPFVCEGVPVFVIALGAEKGFCLASNAVAPVYHRAEDVEGEGLYVRYCHRTRSFCWSARGCHLLVCPGVPPVGQPGGATCWSARGCRLLDSPRVPPVGQPGGATEGRPTTPWRSMRRATSPDLFASSTKSRRNAAPAVFFRAVPTACCTAVNCPSRIREPGRACATANKPGRSPA